MVKAETTDWPEVVRCAHLEGGLRAINEPGRKVSFVPNLRTGSPKFSLEEYDHFHRNLRSIGFQLLGVDFFEDNDQLKGFYLPNWRPHYGSLGYVANDSSELWDNLAVAGHEVDDFSFVDICRRIAFQVNACSWRLHDLSEAYHRELCNKVRDKDFESGKSFGSINGFHIGLAAHSYFSDFGTLRDYTAEFLAKYVFHKDVPDRIHIKRMSTLRTRVLPNVDCGHPVKQELDKICAEDGWLNIVSAYRDIVVHYAPLELVEGPFPFETSVFQSKTGERFPGIRFHLPQDPIALRSERSTAPALNSASEWQKLKIESRLDGSRGPDALLLAYHSLQWVCAFVRNVAKHTPIKPKQLHLKVGIDGNVKEQTFVDP